MARPDNNDNADTVAEAPTNVDGLIRQTRQPQFVSSSYFLRFKFDEGRYVLAGREKLEGREVLRIEYYPTRLYEENNNRGRRGRRDDRTEQDKRQETEFRRLLNKVFSPGRVRQMVPDVQRICDQLIDSFAGRGRCEFVQELAFPLPGIVISEQLGLAAGEIGTFRRWADAMLAPAQGLLTDEDATLKYADIEAEAIRFAIAHYRGQMSEVARRLRIGRSTLYRKLDSLGLEAGMSDAETSAL